MGKKFKEVEKMEKVILIAPYFHHCIDKCIDDCRSKGEIPYLYSANNMNTENLLKVVVYSDYGIDKETEKIINYFSSVGKQVEIRSL